MTDSDSTSSSAISTGPSRRFGAMFYDGLLCIALLMVATLPFIPFAEGHMLVPSEVGALAYVYRIVLCILVVLFFGFFWTNKGRTLGMQAWRLQVETLSGGLPSWRDVAMRLALACVPWMPALITLAIAEQCSLPNVRLVGLSLVALGPLNYLVALIDPQRRAWHDRFLQTRIVRRAL
ncbi:MAG: RDD family protein [Candidatus Obscuribacterales bacterium]|nr:RDD family protein [Steroidobacteraceae bacterium]